MKSNLISLALQSQDQYGHSHQFIIQRYCGLSGNEKKKKKVHPTSIEYRLKFDCVSKSLNCCHNPKTHF